MSAFAVATSERGNRAFSLALLVSVGLHVAMVASFLKIRPARPPALPPIYQVNLIAAAPGPRAAGVVTPAPTVAPPEAKAPPRPKSDEIVPVKTKTTPKRAPRIATPSVSEKRVERNAPAPVAGGGEEGGRGTDVANIQTEGIVFPYPGYLENIVRQIALGFVPPRGSRLTAEVFFLIKRDGTITGLRFVKRSGSFTFDLEAQGAIENASRRFGPLPDGFSDDVLPVVFTFDPRLVR